MPSLILFWLGCGSGDPAQLYEDGVAEQSPAVCMKIPLNDPRRLECLTTIAHQAASTMDIETAILACAAVQEGTWQDECFFQISDEGNLIGEQARRVCEKAGQFSSRCVNHAASRDVEMNLLNSGQQGQEGRWMSSAVSLLEAYMSPHDARAMARIQVINHIAKRASGHDFTPQTCGSLQDNFCSEVFVVMARESSGVEWSEHCGSALSLTDASRLGFPHWSSAMNDHVARAWKMLCVPIRTQMMQQPPSDHPGGLPR